MESRCKKCGKVLRDPESIARGMGPKCAGVFSGGGSLKVKIGRRSGTLYSLSFSGSVQATLPIVETLPKNLSQSELVCQSRE